MKILDICLFLEHINFAVLLFITADEKVCQNYYCFSVLVMLLNTLVLHYYQL